MQQCAPEMRSEVQFILLLSHVKEKTFLAVSKEATPFCQLPFDLRHFLYSALGKIH